MCVFHADNYTVYIESNLILPHYYNITSDKLEKKLKLTMKN